MRLKVLFAAVAVLFCAFTLAFAADDPPTPTTLPGGKVVNAAEVKEVVESGKAAVYDMRKAMNFEKGHLKGAISLPYDQKSERVENFDSSKDKVELQLLPKEKDKPLLFYSDGPTGWKSYKMAVIAIKQGYKKVLWFRGGTAEWTEKGYTLD